MTLISCLSRSQYDVLRANTSDYFLQVSISAVAWIYLVSVQQEERQVENYNNQSVMQSRTKSELCVDRFDSVQQHWYYNEDAQQRIISKGCYV